jgi:hypothetical protein
VRPLSRLSAKAILLGPLAAIRVHAKMLTRRSGTRHGEKEGAIRRSRFYKLSIRRNYLLHAIVCAILDAGFAPYSALALDDSSEVRMEKILKLIGHCKFSVHDLSRTELPRFNMPPRLAPHWLHGVQYLVVA